jgi:hypothetical protein
MCIKKYKFNYASSKVVFVILAVLNFCYFSIATSTLSIFDCKLSGINMVLSSEPSIVCKVDDPEYRYLLYPAIASLIIYVIGVPALFFVLLFSNKAKIKEAQQTMREQGLTSPRLAGLASPKSLTEDNATQVKYGFLFQQYKPEKFYWEIIIVFRKLLIVASIMLFSDEDPEFQVSSKLSIITSNIDVQQIS